MAHLGLLLILFGTLLNGAFVSLGYEYTPSASEEDGIAHGTFLASPWDIHADLIEVALSYPPFTKIDVSEWPPLYQKYEMRSPYHSFDLSHPDPVDVSLTSRSFYPQKADASFDLPHPRPSEVLTALHLTPLMLLIGILTKHQILFWGPGDTVLFYYWMAALGLAVVCTVILRGWGDQALAFVTLLFSAPFLLILSRGNQGALIASISLILFIYLACCTERYILAAVLLALACNVHPNTIALAPLFFCFGPRRLVGGILAFTMASAGCLLLAYGIDQHLYPGYSFAAFKEALGEYYRLYVLGSSRDAENCSALGAFKHIDLFLDYTHAWSHQHLYDLMGKVLAACLLPLTLCAGVLFAWEKLSRMEFAYISVAVYALASAQFSAYHLFVFAIFPLLLCRERETRKFGRLDHLILFSSVLILIPKTYFYIHSVSPGVVLNPIVMLAVTLFIFGEATGLDFPAKLKERLKGRVDARAAVS